MVQRLREFISDPELPTLYLELDETLVDLYGGVNSALNKFGYPDWLHPFWEDYSKDDADAIRWSVVNKVPNFWTNLKFSKEGRKIWEFAQLYKPNVLSACTEHSSSCKEQKKQWIANNLGLNKIGNVHLVNRSEKRQFALDANGKPNLLIDDYELNCNEFRLAGGIAIQTTNSAEVISKLRKLGFK